MSTTRVVGIEPSKIHIVRRELTTRGGPVGAPLGTTRCGMPYVIGFRSARTAENVRLSIHPSFDPALVRSDRVTRLEHVAFDSDAVLYVPKRRAGGGPARRLFPPDEVPTREFLSWPFRQDTGIIVPISQVDEDDDTFVFLAHVVEPRFFRSRNGMLLDLDEDSADEAGEPKRTIGTSGQLDWRL